MNHPVISQLWLYPIKSLDGVRVSSATIGPKGSLAADRVVAIKTPEGKFVNGKQEPRLHLVRAQFSDLQTVTLTTADAAPQSFSLPETDALAKWFTRFLGYEVIVQYDDQQGFPDDLEASGPTLISLATLETLAGWFPGITTEQMRQRLRPNIVLDHVPPFEEDRLVGPQGTNVPFSLGSVQLFGSKACQRCVVPSRDPLTAEAWRGFQLQFSKLRAAHLPSWATRSRFDHFYRAAVNTTLEPSQVDLQLHEGDAYVCRQDD